MFERILSQQGRFFDAHREAKCPILLLGLNETFLGIDNCSGKLDHMLNIAKYVTYNSWLPKHALRAVRILSHIMRQPDGHTMVLSEFTRTNELANELRHGFAKCLESDLSVFIDTKDTEGACRNGNESELTMNEEIIKLLEEFLSHSAPNFSHYLLGFDITNDVLSTLLQQPGVSNFPSNCSSSLLTILDECIQQLKFGIEIPFNQQRLLKNGYSLLHKLCLDQNISAIISSFLHECNEFLSRHCSALPLLNHNNPFALNQMANLLKCVAADLERSSMLHHSHWFQNATITFHTNGSVLENSSAALQRNNVERNVSQYLVE